MIKEIRDLFKGPLGFLWLVIILTLLCCGCARHGGFASGLNMIKATPASSARAIPNLTPLVLSVSGYPSNELAGVDLFKFYATTNLNTLLINWQLVGQSKNPSWTNNFIPAQMFFFATASNIWGESAPSMTNSTPPPPRFITNLNIKLQ